MNIPFSQEFNDTYWNTKDPIKQSYEVFCKTAMQAANNLFDKKPNMPLIVLELGFGAGLNFIITANEFLKHYKAKKLHFVSIEKNPLSTDKLSKIYQDFKLPLHLSQTKDQILMSLEKSKLKIGFNRIKIYENITLDLLIGEAEEMLNQSEFQAHAMYLDGFAPSKNPQMWDINIMNELRRLSDQNCIISTYSAASKVKKVLNQSGFIVKTLSGINKRERIMATPDINQTLPKIKDIYFKRTYVSPKKTALIIGAGIAGIATAIHLKDSMDIIIAEKQSKVATNGSGNTIGALMPLITQPDVLLGQMHQMAFEFAKDFYKKNLDTNLIKFNGAYAYAHDQNLLKRYSSRNDYNINTNSIYIDTAASLCPHKACQFLSKDIKINFNHELISFKKIEKGYEATFSNGNKIVADMIVFALGSDSKRLFKQSNQKIALLDDTVQISSVRGQTTNIKDQINMLKKDIDQNAVHSSKGYLTSEFEGIRVIGATFERENNDKNPKKQDDEINIKDTSAFFETKPQIIGSYVGFRSYSGDRFPIIGLLHDKNKFYDDYKSIFWGKTSNKLPQYHDGLFINTAHGARGLCTAILGAKIIADLVNNVPFCVPRQIIYAMASSRFLIRNLKKGKINNINGEA